jgi:hypothetical protein
MNASLCNKFFNGTKVYEVGSRPKRYQSWVRNTTSVAIHKAIVAQYVVPAPPGKLFSFCRLTTGE